MYTIVVNASAVAKYKVRENSARDKWLKAVQKYHNKSLASFTKAALASPPSTPTKGKLAGKCEPPNGWVRYFARQGLVTLKPIK